GQARGLAARRLPRATYFAIMDAGCGSRSGRHLLYDARRLVSAGGPTGADSRFLTTENAMAWNEPGGGNNSNNQDPWGGGNRGGGDNRGGKQGPPDLDEALRKLQDSLNGIFGNKKSGGSGGNGRRVGGGQGIPRG